MKTMPRLIGSDLDTFARWMRSKGYALETNEVGGPDRSADADADASGVIVATTPARGESWSPESTTTKVSYAKEGKQLFMPDVLGMTFTPANLALAAISPRSVTPFPAANEPKWQVVSIQNGSEDGPTIDPGDPVDPSLDITLIMDEPANPQAEPAVVQGALVGGVAGAVLGAAIGTGLLEQGSLVQSLAFGALFGALGGALGAIVASRVRR